MRTAMKTAALALALVSTLVACRNHAARADGIARAVIMEPCVTDADCTAGLVCNAGVCVSPGDAGSGDSGPHGVRLGHTSPTPADAAVGAEISDVARGCRCGSFVARRAGGPWLVGVALAFAWRRRRRA